MPAARATTVRDRCRGAGAVVTLSLRNMVGASGSTSARLGHAAAASVGANAGWLPSPFAASRKSATNSAQDWYLWAGFFASARAKVACNASGRCGATSIIGGMGLVRCADIAEAIEVAVNGGRPVSRWNAVHPRE